MTDAPARPARPVIRDAARRLDQRSSLAGRRRGLTPGRQRLAAGVRCRALPCRAVETSSGSLLSSIGWSLLSCNYKCTGGSSRAAWEHRDTSNRPRCNITSPAGRFLAPLSFFLFPCSYFPCFLCRLISHSSSCFCSRFLVWHLDISSCLFSTNRATGIDQASLSWSFAIKPHRDSRIFFLPSATTASRCVRRQYWRLRWPPRPRRRRRSPS